LPEGSYWIHSILDPDLESSSFLIPFDLEKDKVEKIEILSQTASSSRFQSSRKLTPAGDPRPLSILYVPSIYREIQIYLWIWVLVLAFTLLKKL
jgi:hypothetical protein